MDTAQKKAKGISLRFLIVAAVFLLALALFAFIANEMVLENENNLDRLAFQHLAHITNPSVTGVMVIITFFGSSYFLLPAYLLLIGYFLIFKKTRRLSLDVAAIGISSSIILFSLKAIFHRHRPLDPLVKNVNGFSFPSGHSFSSFTLFGLLIYILWNHKINPVLRWVLTILFILFATAIAFSRVYLHVHFASDVIAGFCLCILWLAVSLWLLRKFSPRL
ncbi:MAG: phosphatase PAP2 family protein [Flavisolibacter sp.]